MTRLARQGLGRDGEGDARGACVYEGGREIRRALPTGPCPPAPTHDLAFRVSAALPPPAVTVAIEFLRGGGRVFRVAASISEAFLRAPSLSLYGSTTPRGLGWMPTGLPGTLGIRALLVRSAGCVGRSFG